MIMKSLTSRIVSSYIDKLWEEQEQKIKARSKKESDEYADAQAEYDKVKNMTSDEWIRYHYGASTMMGATAAAIKETGLEGAKLAEYLKNLYEHRLDALEVSVENANKALNDATAWTDKDILDVVSGIENLKGGLYDNLYNAISQWYTFGEDSDKNLSNLQQGIQGITEDTAGALEAYMNGVSQQVYLQSEYLRRIAEVMTEDANPNDDIEIASLSQILLQLQQSYTVQQSIRNILEGWNNSNGQAVRVELVS
jgi:type I site-specific restriction endonuclease